VTWQASKRRPGRGPMSSEPAVSLKEVEFPRFPSSGHAPGRFDRAWSTGFHQHDGGVPAAPENCPSSGKSSIRLKGIAGYYRRIERLVAGPRRSAPLVQLKLPCNPGRSTLSNGGGRILRTRRLDPAPARPFPRGVPSLRGGSVRIVPVPIGGKACEVRCRRGVSRHMQGTARERCWA